MGEKNSESSNSRRQGELGALPPQFLEHPSLPGALRRSGRTAAPASLNGGNNCCPQPVSSRIPINIFALSVRDLDLALAEPSLLTGVPANTVRGTKHSKNYWTVPDAELLRK